MFRNLGYKKLEEFAIVLFIVLSGFIISAVFKLSNFVTFPNLDEMLWHPRSRIFWDKMLEFDFSGLIQSLQPGITVYWFTGFLLKFIDFDYGYLYRLIAEKEAQGLDFNSVVNVNDPEIYKTYETISFAFNFPLILLGVIFFILFYYLLRKLDFNRITAYFSILFISNNIFFTYWNTPSDKMLNIFLALSFLTFLIYLEKKGGKKYLVFSAIFGSWAVLSKLTALFILPFYFAALVFYNWPLSIDKIKSVLKNWLLWLLVFILISVIFLPTIVFHPGEVYNLFFNSSVYERNYAASGYFSRIIDYIWIFINVVSLGPTAWIFLAVYFFFSLKKKYKNRFNYVPIKTLKTINIFILLFVIAVMMISQNHDTRFMSPVFLLANITASVGLYVLIELIVEKYKFQKTAAYALAVVILIFSQIFSIAASGNLAQEVAKKILDRYF